MEQTHVFQTGEGSVAQGIAKKEEMDNRPDDIGDAIAAVSLAEAAYADAKEEEEAAHQRAVEALSSLNVAQKELDSLLMNLRTEAPKESDWGRRQGTHVTGSGRISR